MPQDTLLTQTKKALRRFDLRARKSLGQHFLVDAEVLSTIISAADLKPEDTVIEVGPGLGLLTRELARHAGRVIAVELDDRIADLLQQEMAGNPRVSIVHADILDSDPAALLDGHGPYQVVANLPYYITSPVLRHFLEAAAKPQRLVVMVQKEVAQAIVAGPGQRSILSIAVQFYGRAEIVRTVPPQAFYPVPEVASAILRINVYPRPPVPVTDAAGFFRLVRAGFSAPRKQLTNALARGLDCTKSEALSLLDSAGIAPQRRAETLTLEEWARLWQILTGAANADR